MSFSVPDKMWLNSTAWRCLVNSLSSHLPCCKSIQSGRRCCWSLTVACNKLQLFSREYSVDWSRESFPRIAWCLLHRLCRSTLDTLWDFVPLQRLETCRQIDCDTSMKRGRRSTSAIKCAFAKCHRQSHSKKQASRISPVPPRMLCSAESPRSPSPENPGKIRSYPSDTTERRSSGKSYRSEKIVGEICRRLLTLWNPCFWNVVQVSSCCCWARKRIISIIKSFQNVAALTAPWIYWSNPRWWDSWRLAPLSRHVGEPATKIVDSVLASQF